MLLKMLITTEQVQAAFSQSKTALRSFARMGRLLKAPGSLKLFLLVLLWFQASARGILRKSGYQTLVIAHASNSKTGLPKKIAGLSLNNETGFWTVQISHRDGPTSPFRQSNVSVQELLNERLKRDVARVESINTHTQLAATGVKGSDLKSRQRASQISAEAFSSPIVSGFSQGSGEYFTRIGIGTPPREAYLVIDTGSDLSWIQCAPCGDCYLQSDPIFIPTLSSSYERVTCTSPLCSELDVRGCISNECLYQVSYGDGSFTIGNFALESLSLGGTTVRNVGIGCGHDNEGLFVGAAGLLGLGGGTLSFPSQVAFQISSKFSYCLQDRVVGGTSSLIFGDGAEAEGSSFTSLLKNPKLDTFYYVPLTGISVGGSRLPISASQFSMESSGNGGVILDSGTSVTRLVAPAYTALRDAFREGTRNLPPAGVFSLFDTCFAFGGMESVEVPTVALVFQSGATMALPASNYMVQVDEFGTYCLAFAPTSASLSIIGNLQQQGFRLAFDTSTARLGIAEKQC